MGTAKTNIQDVKLNHRKCQKTHSEIVSGRQELGQPGLWLVAIAKRAGDFPTP